MSDGFKGLLAMTGSASIWGLSGIYYKLLDDVPPLEVLCHRVVWSALFFGAFLAARGALLQVRAVFRNRGVLRRVVFASAMIAINWFGFIFSIQNGHALEASLGYYIFPLFAVALGYLALGERFSRLQGAAIGLAALAVLALTLGLGVPPWISLLLAGSFSLYGLVKKRLAVGAFTSVFIESLLLAPLALLWIGIVHAGPSGGAFGDDWVTTLLLIGSGPLTAIPLILMSYAVQRLSYSSIGLVQYLNPTLQALVAVFVLGEAFTRWHAIAFPMIWAGLAIYAAEAWRQDRDARRAVVRSGTVSKTVM